ncbi:MAG: hypothetical protein O3A01_06635 [bacterium]|nr:hypothetical protein [bacterium]
MSKRGILIVDHGSRLQAANEMIFDVAAKLQVRLPEAVVRGVHMELAEPSIMSGFSELISEGVTDIKVIPFMLSPGRHSTRDIPQLAAEAAAAHQNIPYSVAAHIGQHELITDVLMQHVFEN